MGSEMCIRDSANRVHIVIEVDDIEEARTNIALTVDEVIDTSWGTRLFQVHDPDGIPITYLQWLEKREGRA